MMRSASGPGFAHAVILLAVLCALAAGRVRAESARSEIDLGIALALNGEPARAESLFVSHLSRVPGDAAAFTNLGNLRLMAGEPDVALFFYHRAMRSDSADAGIRLDEAAALLLLGEDEEAERSARAGIDMAGGVRRGASLLGIHQEFPGGPGRAAETSRMSREELLDLLRAASGRVPLDSLRGGVRADSTRNEKARKPGPTWRLAGPRAEGSSSLPTLLYWKR